MFCICFSASQGVFSCVRLFPEFYTSLSESDFSALKALSKGFAGRGAPSILLKPNDLQGEVPSNCETLYICCFPVSVLVLHRKAVPLGTRAAAVDWFIGRLCPKVPLAPAYFAAKKDYALSRAPAKLRFTEPVGPQPRPGRRPGAAGMRKDLSAAISLCQSASFPIISAGSGRFSVGSQVNRDPTGRASRRHPARREQLRRSSLLFPLAATRYYSIIL